jgi:CBS domain-containing protein/SAM-dependent methyltransferase
MESFLRKQEIKKGRCFMKVADIMQKSLITVNEDTPIKEAARLIFSLGLAGLPVVDGQTIVGIITEQDILSKMYPTIQELMDDYIHAQDFEAMEKNLTSYLDAPVATIMNKKVVSVGPNTPIMQAQSIMLINRFGRLPIVDAEKNLLGIVSQGDIFRHLIKEEIPRLESERYAGFVASHYDVLVNWEKRFNFELPILIELFKKYRIESILDIGVWTGEYTIGLAKKWPGKIVGLDQNSIMIAIAEEKKDKLGEDIRNRITFMLTDYQDFAERIAGKLDGAICMGNSLPHILVPLDELLQRVSQVLRDKDGVLIAQLLNFEKILQRNNRLISFSIEKSVEEKEHLFIEFFDQRDSETLLHNVIIFASDGTNWLFEGITTIPVRYLRQAQIKRAAEKNGFKKITFSGGIGEYQGDYGPLSFDQEFKPLESDWLNFVAIK